MSATLTLTGRLGTEPEIKFTKTGKAVLTLPICATPAQKNQTSGQWEDQGATLWIRATFWEYEAENLAETLHKGDTVSVTGTLKLDTYPTADGQTRESLEVMHPRFLGVKPRQNGQAPQASAARNGTYATPTDDPWGTSANDPAPF
ncbi:single-stranded DNA-binding protein [Schaalia sp. lx-100]|uniref:single-stranded DNA-binding protein n=1 Tax=Schaalia sp. lx-100 TaxID=2899081 RepID=UPI001E43C360|nr:single-stranded DNA-binding protein [Schaalia sp. lx-100]MCD4557628.1 single-stranded DNA-binding protein [Schaalia sp. lx-100]